MSVRFVGGMAIAGNTNGESRFALIACQVYKVSGKSFIQQWQFSVKRPTVKRSVAIMATLFAAHSLGITTQAAEDGKLWTVVERQHVTLLDEYYVEATRDMDFAECTAWAERVGEKNGFGPGVREGNNNIVLYRHEEERIIFSCVKTGNQAAAFVEGPEHLLEGLGLNFGTD